MAEPDYVDGRKVSQQKTMDKWREVTLGNLVEIRHGFAFKGDYIHDEPQGDVLLTPGNFAIGGGSPPKGASGKSETISLSTMKAMCQKSLSFAKATYLSR